jgi:hypothetical protein
VPAINSEKEPIEGILRIFNLNLDIKTNLEEVERIASYSQRYSLVCRVMMPFQACFNRMIAEHWNGHDRSHWTDEAKLAIRMWRAALVIQMKLTIPSRSGHSDHDRPATQ